MAPPEASVTDRRDVMRIACDLIVVGGGAAGLAAAATASRKGLKTVLIERYGFCGGGAVAGMSGTVCGLYAATDRPNAPPQKIVHGFVDDFIRVMEDKGGLAEPVKYGLTWTRVHHPLVWRDAADALLEASGVRLFFHTVVTGALFDGDAHIAGVVAWTKQGPLEVRAGLTIDASGDADVAAMAGLATFVGSAGRVQNPTMMFRLGGVDVARFRDAYGTDTIMPPAVTQSIIEANASGSYKLPRAKIWLFPTTQPNELLCNCTRVIGRDGRELLTILADDFTEAEVAGRLQVREYARFFKDRLVGCEISFVSDTGPQVGVRQTRQIEGRQKLTNSDVVSGAKQANGIAVSAWPIELHSGQRPQVEWLLDDVYEVPFGCLVPASGSGLLIAGRCLSAEHEAVASARVTAQCFAYGQAAGLAAFVSIRDGVPTSAIEGSAIRELLNRDGACLDS